MLILSLLTLFAGPLLYQWLRRGGLIARAFDRLIVIALVLVVVFLLVPEAVAGLGPVALALMLGGYLVPGLLEAGIKRAAQAFHFLSMCLALAGLALHAMLDGAGLRGSGLSDHDTLALAIVLHRLGVGLVLWLIVQPAFGARAAWLVLALVSATTVLGYSLSDWVLPLAGDDAVMIVQSLVIGTIIHSLAHREHMGHGH